MMKKCDKECGLRRKMNSNVDFQVKLARYTEKQLNLALKVSNFQQTQIIEILFDNLTQVIDSEYQNQLSQHLISNDSIPSSSMKQFRNETSQSQPKYFYHILADYYYSNPSESERLQKLCLKLLTNQYLPSIYAMLFYRWMFDSDYQNLSLIHINIFMKGVNRLFWADVQSKTLRYYSLFKFIQNDILLKDNFSSFFNPTNPYSSFNARSYGEADDGNVTPDMDPKDLENVMKSPIMDEYREGKTVNTFDDDGTMVNVQKVIQMKKIDLISIVAKYYFYYENRNSKYKLKPYIMHLSEKCAMDPSQTTDLADEIEKKNKTYSQPNDKLRLTDKQDENFKVMLILISDMFVNENILLISTVDDEEIILSLLTRFQLFSELEITNRTMVKFQAAIYAFTCPGTSNIYTSRLVRAKASKTLDYLFPSGKYARWWLNTSFRLLYYNWPASLWNWSKEKVLQVFNLPNQVWEFVNYHFNFQPEFSIQYDTNSLYDSTTDEEDDQNIYSITFNSNL